MAKQKAWVRFNLDPGAAVGAFPRSFAPAGAMSGNGKNYRTASGELLPDEGRMRLTGED